MMAHQASWSSNDGSNNNKNHDGDQTITTEQQQMDKTWKIVGSPPRQNTIEETTQQQQLLLQQEQVETKDRRRSISSSSTSSDWPSFGGAFQWEGPSIFNDSSTELTSSSNHYSQHPHHLPPPSPLFSSHPYYQPRSRSLSFSMGQDPTNFGYEYYSNSRGLDTTMEEEDDNDKMSTTATRKTVNHSQQQQSNINNKTNDLDIQLNRIRIRSQSSGGSFNSMGRINPSPTSPLTPSSSSSSFWPPLVLQPAPPSSQPLTPLPRTINTTNTISTTRHPPLRRGSEQHQQQPYEDYFQRYPPLFETNTATSNDTSTAGGTRFSNLFQQQQQQHQRRASQPFTFSDPVTISSDMSYPYLYHQQHRRNSLSSTASVGSSHNFPLQPPPTPVGNMELSLPPPFILDTTAFTINKQSQQSSPLPSPSIPLSPQSIIGSNNSTSYIPPSNLQKVPEEQLTATKDSSALSPMIDSVSTIENTETKNTNNDSNDKKEDNQNLVSSNSNTTKNPILSSSTKQVSSTTTKTTKTMTTADIVAAAISKPKQKSTSTEKNKENILYMIEFKAGRTDFFYISDNNNMIRPKIGDLVIVEADRGKDLGKVAMNNLSIEQVTLLQSQKSSSNNNNNDKNTNNSNNQSDTPLSSSSLSSSDIITTTTTTSGILSSSSSASTELISNDTLANTNNNSQHIKQIYRLAQSDEVNQLLLKNQDEQSALSVCQQKIKQRKLRMDVVDAEYQWDRRKLTFYFIAERRIDFRELVRELFKVYKTRIWMCAVNPQTTNSTNKNTILNNSNCNNSISSTSSSTF